MALGRWEAVPFGRVTIGGGFWGPRLRCNRERTMAYEYEQCRDTGRIDALRLRWRPGMEPRPHFFWDSDVAKWLEAASYTLATHPDAELAARVEEVADLVAAAQQPDGYLNSYFTTVAPEGRGRNLRDHHELYCAGHLIEAAVAHHGATGRPGLLEVACRLADHIDRAFGRGEGQRRGYPGHEELELALVRLYRATREPRYLRLARYFVDERGTRPHYFETEAAERGERPRTDHRYWQAHAPVREQRDAVGHAVRAMYLYSAMADLAAETEDAGLRAACEALWADVAGRHMYVTGGIGSFAGNEGFTGDYELPNESAYCETCAAVGLVFWAHRMLGLGPDTRYADVLERALYNAVLSGVSLDGRRFFYSNPLATAGGVRRQDWFGCACCPPNVARLLASLGQYAYGQRGSEVAVHLYAQGSARLDLGQGPAAIHQVTDYPWDGAVALRWELRRPTRAGLLLRVPGWSAGARVRVLPAGAPAGAEQGWGPALADGRGYVRVESEWHDGDRVELDLPMPVERVRAHPRVRADVGCVALQRGPLVYCLEGEDNADAPPLHLVSIPPKAEFTAALHQDLLGGVVALEGTAEASPPEPVDAPLYRSGGGPATATRLRVRAVPYCTWANRGAGEMRVWLRER